MEVGIVGIGQSGCSTVLAALTAGHASRAAVGTAQRGVLHVPDPRVDYMVSIYKPPKIVPASISFVDLPGLGTSGAARHTLAQIREVDAVLLVVRAFENDTIPHPLGEVNPARDLDRIITELTITDLETLEKRLQRIDESMRKESKEKREVLEQERLLWQRLQAVLEAGRMPEPEMFTAEERLVFAQYNLFALKPMVVLCNIGDLTSAVERKRWEELQRAAAPHGWPCLVMNASLEKELLDFSPEEQLEYLTSVGLTESSTKAIIRTCYEALGVLTFFTACEKEVHAWNVAKGSPAPVAAGRIHTDFEKGFIRAEVVSYADFEKYGSLAAAREHGALRLEGRTYIVQEGDLVVFRFSV